MEFNKKREMGLTFFFENPITPSPIKILKLFFFVLKNQMRGRKITLFHIIFFYLYGDTEGGVFSIKGREVTDPHISINRKKNIYISFKLKHYF